MEAGGLAIGIVTLAGLFNNAVDCFEYVHLGCNFGTRFQTSLLKLDNAGLRLSRWGQAMGLSDNLEDVKSLQGVSIQAEDRAIAERLLGQIMELFEAAERASAKYKNAVGAGHSSLAVLDVQADLGDMGQALHEKMRKLRIRRQNKTSLHLKVKWALYEEKQLTRLIDDIIDLVNDLLEMFPAAKKKQLGLCETEVSEIGMEYLSILIEIVRTQDKDLEAAISAAMRSNSKYGAAFYNHNSKIANQTASMTIHGSQTINL